MLHMSIEPATREGANRLHTHPAKSHKLLSHSQMKYKRALTWAAGYGSKPKAQTRLWAKMDSDHKNPLHKFVHVEANKGVRRVSLTAWTYRCGQRRVPNASTSWQH